MATHVPLLPPEGFDFAHPQSWTKWRKRFERYRLASGLSEKDEAIQVSALIYAMGEKAEEILDSCELSEADAMKYDAVTKCFQDHFIQRHNPIFERAKFNQRTQQQGESVDSFVTALHSLAEHCDYGALREQMIRDRFVVGLLDANLSEKLQMESDLKLRGAVDKARNSEAVKSQQPTVRSATAQATHMPVAVDALHLRHRRQRRQASHNSTAVHQTHSAVTAKPQRPSQASPSVRKCGWCGKDRHARESCPAKNARCHQCNKLGHYSSVCRSSSRPRASMNSVQEDSFLGAISSDVPWTRRIFVNGTPVPMKLDTGADVTAIPETVYRTMLRSSPRLSKPDRVLRGPDGSKLPVLGSFRTSLSTTGHRCSQRSVYVVRGLQLSLLGRPEIQALRLLRQLNAVTTNPAPKGDVPELFPALFSGLGEFKGLPYKISLKENASPYSLAVPRRLPIPMTERVAQELKRMEKLGVIRKVEQPTDWCAGMVIVPKANGTIRICCDFTRLNESIRRERHVLPSVQHLLASIQRAQFFTKLDANSGFHQIPLDPSSQLLTTFITPFGRFCYCRLPFGISSAPEYFQKRMAQVLDDLEGVVCMIDDVLVFGKTEVEHDRRLNHVLKRLQNAGITLNKAKCAFRQTSIHFCGYVIDGNGVRPDPAKTEALALMPRCRNVADVRRFLGMANQLGQFTPNLTSISKPLRDLLKKDSEWCWNEAQQSAFDNIKAELSSSPTLALYNPNYPTRISADASSFGLGAVLTQKQPSGDWRPVAYQSRAMVRAEQQYSQIEKEALAITWACDRFSHFLVGLTFHIYTDHKPLVPLLSTKSLDQLPPRVLRFRLRLMRYHFSISHVPGKDLITADALSRAPTRHNNSTDQTLLSEATSMVAVITDSLPASDHRLAEIQTDQARDDICQSIISYCKRGWPDKHCLPNSLKPYWPYRGELTLNANQLLLCGQRIVIPANQRSMVLEQLHEGHQGITKCRQRAKQAVWWPGLSKQLAQHVLDCADCAKSRHQCTEPLLPSEVPSLPWQKLAADFFDYKSHAYLLVVDYYSRFIEIALLRTMSSSETIRHLQSMFARHGIPDELRTDNGSQFTSREFQQFVQKYKFQHNTSSPLFPQSNGMAERAVQTVKELIRSSTDPYSALLAYRTTPLEHGYSPAQLLFGRQLKTSLPITIEQRQPKIPNIPKFLCKDSQLKARQKKNFDSRHRSRHLPPLPIGATVFLPDRQETGQITSTPAQRSYVVSTSTGDFRRNRHHIRPLPATPHTVTNQDSEQITITTPSRASSPTREAAQPQEITSPLSRQQQEANPSQHNPGRTVTRSGRLSKPPNRLIYGKKEKEKN